MPGVEGYVDDQGQAVIEIRVGGSRGEIILNAIVDTGFSGDVSLPTSIAVQLGLELCGSETFELADGSRVEGLVFVGRLGLGNEEREAEIILSNSQEAPYYHANREELEADMAAEEAEAEELEQEY